MGIDVVNVGRVDVESGRDISCVPAPVIAHITVGTDPGQKHSGHQDRLAGQHSVDAGQKFERQRQIVAQRRVVVEDRVTVAMIEVRSPTRIVLSAADQVTQFVQAEDV